MPQEIHVVQCYSCRMYQVDIVKKVPKWTCKLCGEKQSLKRVFFNGSGKECRLQVQKLNEIQAANERNHFTETVLSSEEATTGRKELNKTENHRQREGKQDDNKMKRSENSTNISSEIETSDSKLRKMEHKISIDTDWAQFLSDESSD